MKFEFLVICPPDIAEANFFEQILWQALTDNLNEMDPDQLGGAVKTKLVRHLPLKPDGNGKTIQRVIFGFDVELDDDTQSLAAVIESFATAIEGTDGVDHLVKFFDQMLLARNLEFMRRIFAIEMKLRKALSLIYLTAYDKGFYDLLREENIEILKRDGKKPDERELGAARENEFFHLLFSQYTSLNNRRLPKQVTEIIQLLRDSFDFETARAELSRRPVSNEADADFLTSLKTLLDPIEKLRNCVAHNRSPSQTAINQFQKAATDLEGELDGFLSKEEPIEDAPEDTAAQEAVEGALEGATWDAAARTITLYDPDDDRIRSTVKSRGELVDYLQRVATNAFTAKSDLDGAQCDGWGFAEEAMEPLEERLKKFFAEQEDDTPTTQNTA